MKNEFDNSLEGVEFQPDETPPELRWGDDIEIIEVKSEPDVKTEPIDDDAIYFEQYMNLPDEDEPVNDAEEDIKTEPNWE